MYFVRTPAIFRRIFRDILWKVDTSEKAIFLTFDDGPDPSSTEMILDLLDEFKAGATFFCTGKKIVKYPALFEKIISHGHAAGNHTFEHLNGLSTGYGEYVANVQKFDEVYQTVLFRPPYGRLTLRQYRLLRRTRRIVMWSVLPGDFDSKVSAEQCLVNGLVHSGPGSIIVFHDFQRSKEKLEYVLPRYLAHFSKLGYRFSALRSPYIPLKS